MSSPEVYAAFLNETRPIYQAMTDKKFTRTVLVRSVNETAPGFYRVEWDATDRRIGQGLTDTEEETRTFISEIRFINAPQSVSYDDRFLNPLGFTVINYSVAQKKK